MNFLRNFLSKPAVKRGLTLAAVAATTVALHAQDLEAEAGNAKTSIMNILKIGLGVVSAVVMIGGLVVSAVQFSKKNPDALWYLIGTVAASALLAVAAVYAG